MIHITTLTAIVGHEHEKIEVPINIVTSKAYVDRACAQCRECKLVTEAFERGLNEGYAFRHHDEKEVL